MQPCCLKQPLSFMKGSPDLLSAALTFLSVPSVPLTLDCTGPRGSGSEWRAHAGEMLCAPTRATPSSQLSPLFLLAHRPCALSQGLYHWELANRGGTGGWERGETNRVRRKRERVVKGHHNICKGRTAFFIILSSMCSPDHMCWPAN